MENDTLLDLRTELLSEALSKSDKKDIDRMIKKAMTSPTAEQKKEFKKIIKDELSSSAMKKIVAELVAKESKQVLQSKDGKDAVADITKRVLVKLYRELAYNYTPLIDRIKL